MVEPYGLAAMLVAVLMGLITLREYLRKKFNFPTFIEWTAVWLILFLTGLYPGFYKRITAALGMATPIHFVTTFSIMALLAIVYQLYRRMVELDRRLAKVVQHLALTSPGSRLESGEEGERGREAEA